MTIGGTRRGGSSTTSTTIHKMMMAVAVIITILTTIAAATTTINAMMPQGVTSVQVQPWAAADAAWASTRIFSVTVEGTGSANGLSCTAYPIDKVRWATAQASLTPSITVDDTYLHIPGTIDDFSNTVSFPGATFLASRLAQFHTLAVVLRPGGLAFGAEEKVTVKCTSNGVTSPEVVLRTPTTQIPEYLFSLYPTTSNDEEKTISLSGEFDGRVMAQGYSGSFACVIPSPEKASYSVQLVDGTPLALVLEGGATFTEGASRTASSVQFPIVNFPKLAVSKFTIQGVLIKNGGESTTPSVNPTLVCGLAAANISSVFPIPLPKNVGKLDILVLKPASNTDFIQMDLNGAIFPAGLRSIAVEITTPGYQWGLPKDYNQLHPNSPNAFINDVSSTGVFDGADNTIAKFDNIVQDFVPAFRGTIPFWIVNAVIVPIAAATQGELSSPPLVDPPTTIDIDIKFGAPWSRNVPLSVPIGSRTKENYQNLSMSVLSNLRPTGTVAVGFDIDRLGGFDQYQVALKCTLSEGLRWVANDNQAASSPTISVGFNNDVNGFSLSSAVSEDLRTLTIPKAQALSRIKMRLDVKDWSVTLTPSAALSPSPFATLAAPTITCQDMEQEFFAQPQTFSIQTPVPVTTSIAVSARVEKGRGKTAQDTYVVPTAVVKKLPASTTAGSLEFDLSDLHNCSKFISHDPSFMDDARTPGNPLVVIDIGGKLNSDCKIVQNGFKIECPVGSIPVHADAMETLTIDPQTVMIIRTREDCNPQPNVIVSVIVGETTTEGTISYPECPAPTILTDYETTDFTTTLIPVISDIIVQDGSDKGYTMVKFKVDGSKKKTKLGDINLSLKSDGGVSFMVHQPTPKPTTPAAPIVKINGQDSPAVASIVNNGKGLQIRKEIIDVVAEITLPNVYLVLDENPASKKPPTKTEFSVGLPQWDLTRTQSLSVPIKWEDFKDKDGGEGGKDKKSHLLRNLLIILVALVLVACAIIAYAKYKGIPLKSLFKRQSGNDGLLLDPSNDQQYDQLV